MKASFGFAVDVLIVVVSKKKTSSHLYTSQWNKWAINISHFHRPKLDLFDIFHPNFSRTDHAYKLFEGLGLLTVGNLIVEDNVMPSM